MYLCRVLLFVSGLALGMAKYTEHLTIQPLSRYQVLSTFDFELSQNVSSDNVMGIQEYTTFPRSLGQIIDQCNTQELHLRFGQGWWDAENWGSPPDLGNHAGGIGVELWAWVDGDSIEDAWRNWKRLVHLLGGYFCASINFIDSTQTTLPSEAILTPHGPVSNKTWLMRGALPAEPICTENLTPFLKLLPCQGKAGIATLLDGHTLFSSQWQTMSVDVWHPHSDSVALRQMVSNVANTERCGEDPQPWYVPSEKLLCDDSKPWANDWTCFPVPSKTAEYTLSKIFGSAIKGHCPLAPKGEPAVTVNAPESWLVNGRADLREFLLDGDSELLDISFKSEDANKVSPHVDPLLHVERSFSGWGQQYGGIRTILSNPNDSAISVSYLETLPWFMRIYLHTMRLAGSGNLTNTHYVPARDRQQPSQLELYIELPAGTQVEIEYAFDKSLLFLEEYPPDANHGFEVPPGLAVARTPSGTYEVRTSSLLLSLPVPDFSMPYNVIILTSTVIALAFGTLFNLVARDVVREGELPPSQSPIAKLRQKIHGILKR